MRCVTEEDEDRAHGFSVFMLVWRRPTHTMNSVPRIGDTTQQKCRGPSDEDRYSSPVRNCARPLPKLQSASEDKLRALPLAGDGKDVIEDMIEIVHGYMA